MPLYTMGKVRRHYIRITRESQKQAQSLDEEWWLRYNKDATTPQS